MFFLSLHQNASRVFYSQIWQLFNTKNVENENFNLRLVRRTQTLVEIYNMCV